MAYLQGGHVSRGTVDEVPCSAARRHARRQLHEERASHGRAFYPHIGLTTNGQRVGELCSMACRVRRAGTRSYDARRRYRRAAAARRSWAAVGKPGAARWVLLMLFGMLTYWSRRPPSPSAAGRHDSYSTRIVVSRLSSPPSAHHLCALVMCSVPRPSRCVSPHSGVAAASHPAARRTRATGWEVGRRGSSRAGSARFWAVHVLGTCRGWSQRPHATVYNVQTTI